MRSCIDQLGCGNAVDSPNRTIRYAMRHFAPNTNSICVLVKYHRMDEDGGRRKEGGGMRGEGGGRRKDDEPKK